MPAAPPPPPLDLGLGSGLGSVSGSVFTDPPPSSAPPERAAVAQTPPTSPQLSQHAARELERSSRALGSPQNRRFPATATAAAVPSTFNGQPFQHLPAHLAAQLAAHPPLSVPSQHSHHSNATAFPPPSVSLTFLISGFVFNFFFFNRCHLLPLSLSLPLLLFLGLLLLFLILSLALSLFFLLLLLLALLLWSPLFKLL
jgi:hypothetical protein